MFESIKQNIVHGAMLSTYIIMSYKNLVSDFSSTFCYVDKNNNIYMVGKAKRSNS